MTEAPAKPSALRLLPDLCAFGATLAVAYFLKWETKDLVWSLWLGSLVTGYLTLLAALGAAAYVGFLSLRRGDADGKQGVPAILAATAGGLFLLAFFSFHFCGFHAGHSVFLNLFFPLEGLPSDGFGQAFMFPPLLWRLAFTHLMEPYGIFLVPAIIAERNHVFGPLLGAVRAARAGRPQNDRGAAEPEGKPGKRRHAVGDAMSRPYRNVVRMHLLIFFFAFSHYLKIDSFLVFAVVYSVYFFPWGEVKRLASPSAVG